MTALKVYVPVALVTAVAVSLWLGRHDPARGKRTPRDPDREYPTFAVPSRADERGPWLDQQRRHHPWRTPVVVIPSPLGPEHFGGQ